MKDFCDLLGTPDAPLSKIASVKVTKVLFIFLIYYMGLIEALEYKY